MAVEIGPLKQITQELIREADALRADCLPTGVRELPAKLDHGMLTLAVLGQFKRGKSTLINALLGSRVLPASVLPLTSVPTIVQYGDGLSLSLCFTDGREECRAVEDLVQYVTEENNPQNVKAVARAVVSCPAEFLRRPVQVVDTPGVGSIYNHNTETSEAFLGHVDASVMVLGVDPVLTSTEIEWLAKVKGQAERFFFVLNKVDQLSEEEVGQVVAFIHASLTELWGAPGRVYALSAKNALHDPDDPAFAAFRADLAAFLDAEGRRTLLASSRKKVEQAARSLLSLIALEQRAAHEPVERISACIATLRAEEERLTMERARAFWVMDEAQTRLLVELRQALDLSWEKERDGARAAIKAAWEGAATVGKGRYAMAEALKLRLEALFAPLKARAEEACRRRFDSAVSFLHREHQDLAARLAAGNGQGLGLDMPPLDLEVPPLKPSRFYVNVPPELAGLSTAGGSLVNLLPRAWGAWLAQRPFLKQLDGFYEMQRERLLTDAADRFQDRGAAVVTAFISARQQAVRNVRDALQRGLALREQSDYERRAVMEDLIRREENLRGLLEKCEGDR